MLAKILIKFNDFNLFISESSIFHLMSASMPTISIFLTLMSVLKAATSLFPTLFTIAILL